MVRYKGRKGHRQINEHAMQQYTYFNLPDILCVCVFQDNQQTQRVRDKRTHIAIIHNPIAENLINPGILFLNRDV